jgi:hypothetical protein
MFFKNSKHNLFWFPSLRLRSPLVTLVLLLFVATLSLYAPGIPTRLCMIFVWRIWRQMAVWHHSTCCQGHGMGQKTVRTIDITNLYPKYVILKHLTLNIFDSKVKSLWRVGENPLASAGPYRTRRRPAPTVTCPRSQRRGWVMVMYIWKMQVGALQVKYWVKSCGDDKLNWFSEPQPVPLDRQVSVYMP